MSELLKCPFCGGDNIISTYNNFVPALLCGGCGAMMTIPWSLNGNTEDGLQKKWNIRKPMDRIVERLEERLEEQYKLYAIAFNPEDRGGYDAYSDAIEIVRECNE